MRVIVLGGSGQIGSVIQEHLGKRHEVISTSRKVSDLHFLFNPFRDDWSVLGKADVLVNCVGQIAASGAQSFRRVHVALTQCIISNRETIGNPRILQISALGASPRHRTDFLRTKGIADELLLQQPDTAVIRPSIVCTHRTMLVRKMLMLSRIASYTMGVLVVPKKFLATRIRPVMPADLAGVVEAMCTSADHGVVDVVGPEAMTFRNILALLAEARGQKFRLVEAPRKLMDALVGGVIARLFPGVINAQQYALLFEDNVADDGVCKELLQRPMTPVVQFFKNEFSDATN